jgi:hypothetical protein
LLPYFPGHFGKMIHTALIWSPPGPVLSANASLNIKTQPHLPKLSTIYFSDFPSLLALLIPYRYAYPSMCALNPVQFVYVQHLEKSQRYQNHHCGAVYIFNMCP